MIFRYCTHLRSGEVPRIEKKGTGSSTTGMKQDESGYWERAKKRNGEDAMQALGMIFFMVICLLLFLRCVVAYLGMLLGLGVVAVVLAVFFGRKL